MTGEISEHYFATARHGSFYLAAGPEDGPLIIFLHGWPELSISWRHQLPLFGHLGFRAIAPDMRGYGRSRVHSHPSDYAQSAIVADMLELLDGLGRSSAIWVGHDWGSATVWALASHYPERCDAVLSLCVPYATLERGLDACLPLLDRDMYPEDEFPVGQWDYIRFYEEHFSRATEVFDADPLRTVKALFRAGRARATPRPSPTAFIRRNGGWYGGADAAPDLPLDTAVLRPADLSAYAAALARNGFAGPDSYYMNNEANAIYAAKAVNGGRIDMPVLFLLAEYDEVCECVRSRLAEPMQELCDDLTIRRIASGHWMAQEKPREVNAALLRFLAVRLAHLWPGEGAS
ncbi:alpha/beta fold hydrolase [Sneathiella sp.]|uniref:alpha/beta fold hydrolase n=1 Tax=Sneathiella sp. TaxID=1964365 RepID=UPI002FE3AC09